MANAWYRTGTISVTNGSPTIVGSGTLFLGNVNPGDLLFGPDGNMYELVTVADNVTATIKQTNGTAAYLGSTLSGQAYSIIKTGPNNATVATQLTTLATNWQQDRDQYATWLGGTSTGGDGSGNYPLTDALGVSRNVACPAKLAAVAASGLLTGFTAGSGMPLATDTILQAIQKLTGGPGSSQAFSVGALTATVANINATANTLPLQIGIANNGSGNTIGISFYHGIYTKGYIKSISTSAIDAGALTFGTSPDGDLAAERMRITSAGNILVGLSSPLTGAKLEVAGSVSASGGISDTLGAGSFKSNWFALRTYNTGSTVFALDTYNGSAWQNSMCINMSNNVLIGLASASTGSKLEVGGSISATGTTQISCNGTGFINAGSSAGVAQYNTFVNSVGTRRAFYGFGTASDNSFFITNEAGGDLNLNTAGGGLVKTNAGLAVTGSVTSSQGYAIQPNTFRPVSNYFYGLEYLSDSSIKLWLKGSDGTSRGVTFTLA